MSLDPIGTWGDAKNLGNPYAYVGNNPSSWTDPSGLYAGGDDAAACLVGGAVALAVQGVMDICDWRFSGTDYIGEVTGGCAGGEATLYGGPIAGGAVYGAVSSATNYGIHALQGTQEASVGSFATEVGIGTAAGAAGGALAFGAGKVASTALSKAESTTLQKTSEFIESGLHAQKGPLARSGHAPLSMGNPQKVVVIGEDMQGRVIPHAKSIGADYYNPPTAPRSEWMKNNQQWIRDRMDEGCTIIDCGAAPGRANYPGPTSPFYQMELDEIAARGYANYVRLNPEVKIWR